jgi:hypothetical protein
MVIYLEMKFHFQHSIVKRCKTMYFLSWPHELRNLYGWTQLHMWKNNINQMKDIWTSRINGKM